MAEEIISERLKYLADSIDFTRAPSKYTRLLRGKQEPIYKAFGPKVSEIWDLTMGLGEEAWTLARLGYQITGFEQNSALFDCLKRAHQKALANAEWAQVAERLALINADSFNYLQNYQDAIPNIYIDPMFPADEKATALPRKEMQYMRELVGGGTLDIQSWLDLALQKVQFKVVIKQPRYAKLTQHKPHSQLIGKAMRYDIYLARKI